MADPAPLVPGFVDRLGDRVRLTDRGRHVEVLRLRPELTAGPLFEPAVRRRVDQLAGFLHPNAARVLQVGRLAAPDGRLVIVSDAVEGWRLSEVLEAVDQLREAFQPDGLVFLLRQLLGAISSLHDVALGLSHGALGTERLVLAPDGRLVVTESVLGTALRHLPTMAEDRLWRELRLAVASGEAQPFGRLTDLRQVGVIALSLTIGRQLRRDEYPTRLASLVQDATQARTARGGAPVSPEFQNWLVRVLSLTDDATPWSVSEARRELSRLVDGDAHVSSAPQSLAPLLKKVAEYFEADPESPAEEPEPAPAPRVGPTLVPARPPAPAAAPGPATPGRASSHEPPEAHEPPAGGPVAVPAAPIAAPPAPVIPPAVVVAPIAPAAEDPEPPRENPRSPGSTTGPAASLPDDVPGPEPLEEKGPAVLLCEAPPATDAVDPQCLAVFEDSAPVREGAPPKADLEKAVSPKAAPGFAPPAVPIDAARSPEPPGAVTLADAIAPLGAGPALERSDSLSDHAARREARAAAATSSRPMFGVPAHGDEVDEAAPGRKRRLVLIGVAAAALVVVAVGANLLLRSAPAAATDAKRPSSSPAAAAPVTPAPAAAEPQAAAPGAAAPAPAAAAPTPAASAPAAPADSAPPMGIVEIVSSVPLRVSEGGRTLGTSAAPLRLPLGRHTLELRNDELGFQAAQAVDVRQGRTERIQPALPTGLANLNATPWAEVWIDGRRVGETPLGRVELTIGAHEIRFRHPELGEQSRTVTITAGKVALLSVELSK